MKRNFRIMLKYANINFKMGIDTQVNSKIMLLKDIDKKKKEKKF